METQNRGWIVLDASALIAYLWREPGSHVVVSVLDRAAISAVNLSEVLGVVTRRKGRSPGDLLSALLNLGIEVFEFTIQDAAAVAELLLVTKSQGLSLADRACLALGRRLNARILTAERQTDWSKLGIEGIQIDIIR